MIKRLVYGMWLTSLLSLWVHLSETELLSSFLGDNCFVNVVTQCDSASSDWTNDIPQLQDQSHKDELKRQIQIATVTFTIRSVAELNDGIGYDGEINEIVKNLTIKSGYFRFELRFRKACTIFFVFPQTFNETVVSLQKSGYSTSDKVLFFIHVSEFSTRNEIIKAFQGDLFTTENKNSIISTPFYTNIVFFENFAKNGKIGLFCYFCPVTVNKFFMVDNETTATATSSLSTVIWGFFGRQRSNGHGRRVTYTAIYFVVATDLCIMKSFQRRKSFYRSLKFCWNPSESLVASEVMLLLNVTIIVARSRLYDDQAWISEWLLNTYAGESTLFAIPNVIAHTRGGYYTHSEVPWKVISCVSYQSVRVVDYSLREIFVPELWLAIFAVCIALSAIYRKVEQGIDIVWIFVGWGCNLKHPRKVVGFILIFLSIVAYTYSAGISSDLMKLAKLPTFRRLLSKNFKLLIPHGKIVITSLFSSLPKNLQTPVLDYFKSIPVELSDAMLVNRDIWNKTAIDIIENLVKERHMLWGNSIVHLMHLLENGLKCIKETYLCKLISINDEVDIRFDLRQGYRVWGYLSSRMLFLHRMFFETGFYIHARKGHRFISQQQFKGLKISDARGLMKWLPMSIQSTVGVSTLYLFVAETVLLLVWTLVHRQHVIVLGR